MYNCNPATNSSFHSFTTTLMGTNPLLGVSVILEAGMVPMSLFSESAKLCTEHLLCCRVVSGILYVAKLIYL